MAALSILFGVCCGIDVHKKFLVACLLRNGASGEPVRERRRFGTTTAELECLAAWLRDQGCQHVAVESTGVYWKPVFNVLERAGIPVRLANAQHIKNLPGRKTDVSDAEWIATLLRHGLVRESFVPPPEIRALRELTRYRTTLVRQRADECNRIQKLLENCNLKLASVATDVLGRSGRSMLHAIAAGQDDPALLAEMARGRLRKKIPQLVEALRGVVSDTSRWLLGEHLRRVAELDEAIARLDREIGEHCRPFEPWLKLLDQIPGVNRRIAEILVAEIGVDMSRFPTAGHLSSWAGLCPGHHESGGQSKSGRTRKGDRWLRAALVEAGWAAGHGKGTYLAAQYQRLAARRGKKRACVAVGHSILCIAHSLLARPRDYQDLGFDYFERHCKDKIKNNLVRRLRQLGYIVTVEQPAA
jgi:transposase